MISSVCVGTCTYAHVELLHVVVHDVVKGLLCDGLDGDALASLAHPGCACEKILAHCRRCRERRFGQRDGGIITFTRTSSDKIDFFFF